MTPRAAAPTVTAMPTAALVHAALSAAAVGVLLATLRRAGPRAGGLAAAVPVNSLPALFWLSMEQGGAYATSAVLGSLYGTGLTVLVGTGFARLARVARAAWPHPPTGALRQRAGTRAGAGVSMASAGVMSLVVTELSRHSGPQFCGLVAALPLVGSFAAHAGYRQGGVPLMLRVLRGYLDGMTAKAAFLAALAAAWALGAGVWGWPLGLVAGVLALLLQRRMK